MSPTSEIGDENDSDNVANLVAARYEPREAGWYFKAFFDCSDHRIYITRAKRLLKRY